MAGGTWVTQNKVRPGVFINFTSEPQSTSVLGDRGVVTIPLALAWGEPKKILAVNAGDDVSKLLGYQISESQMLLIREALKRARTLLLYRLNTGTKAAVTVGTLVATAKWGGVRGNSLSVVIETNIDNTSLKDVKTLLNGDVVDKQVVANVAGLVSNDYVVFSGSATLTNTAGAPLISGADGTVTNQDYVDYLAAVEVFDFNAMAIPSADSAVKGLALAFVRRLREDEGKKIQAVLENYPVANYEGIISVKNGVVLEDGTTLTAAQSTAWVAGATAGANVNQSLTYEAYDGAIDVATRYTNAQIIAALQAGEFVFTPNNGIAVVEQDINTLITYTPTHGKHFSKNRVIRVLDGIAIDFLKTFSSFYIGKVNNNDTGRNLLKGECIKYLERMQSIEAIQEFSSQTDISVSAGEGADSVLIVAYVQPVDSIEKIYVAVTVRQEVVG
ncbi:phage tail sheath family protein [Paenibacillus sinopodophylli]|uniref:phage tail sheath family protein n=1 Tax=Paenibacillus sinopodophylli TaxID=1837342 RepID=UPI00110D1D67|nr:phage tail sheath family protein [Paenibacillus sinopodophylli]